MTIGPEPISRIDSMSSAAGHQASRCVHEVGEEVEQVAGVVGAGAGLGVVLHAEGGHVGAAEALDHAVVEVHVGDLDAAPSESAATAKLWFWLVISTAAGGQAADRVVAAVVAERQLVGGAAEGRGQELVAEADAEDRHLAEQAADGLGRAWSTAAGSPGPLERNTPSGSRASTSSAVVQAGTTSTVAESAQVAQDRALDAEVVGDDPAAGRRPTV